jgi:hypothetical protein
MRLVIRPPLSTFLLCITNHKYRYGHRNGMLAFIVLMFHGLTTEQEDVSPGAQATRLRLAEPPNIATMSFTNPLVARGLNPSQFTALAS